MDLVKRINICLAVCLLMTYQTSCNHAEPEPDPEFPIVQFKDTTCLEYVLLDPEHGNNYPFTIHSFTEEFMGYVVFKNNYAMSRNAPIPNDCILANIKWEDYNREEHGIRFSDDEIKDSHPLKGYFRVPVEKLGGEFYGEYSEEELQSAINSLIDDGSIEQYRVDLGY